jgi:hypothetical protein
VSPTAENSTNTEHPQANLPKDDPKTDKNGKPKDNAKEDLKPGAKPTLKDDLKSIRWQISKPSSSLLLKA